MSLIYRFRKPALSEAKKKGLLSVVRNAVAHHAEDIDSEHCFYIEANDSLLPDEIALLEWLLRETFEPENFSIESFLARNSESETRNGLLEVGPRMNFTTAWSTNDVSICHACGLTKVTRIERSRRYRLIFGQGAARGDGKWERDFLNLVHDRMTECPYPERLTTFETGMAPEKAYEVKVIEEGRSAIEEINRRLGLGLDEWDIDYYYNLFALDLKRNPTNVECFDLGQSNSEHSRHWFFRGRLLIDGKETPHTLMEIVKEPYRRNPNNSIIAFGDNSSAIRGYRMKTLIPERPGRPSPFIESEPTYHIIFTAETHNFPSGVAPFPGAETGTGGRIRDIEAVGRGLSADELACRSRRRGCRVPAAARRTNAAL